MIVQSNSTNIVYYIPTNVCVMRQKNELTYFKSNYKWTVSCHGYCIDTSDTAHFTDTLVAMSLFWSWHDHGLTYCGWKLYFDNIVLCKLSFIDIISLSIEIRIQALIQYMRTRNSIWSLQGSLFCLIQLIFLFDIHNSSREPCEKVV